MKQQLSYNSSREKNAPKIIILRVQKTKNVLSSRRMKLYCRCILCLIRRHKTIGQLVFIVYTVQDDLLVRVILANLFVRSNWRILYWRFELPCLSSRVSSWLYGHVHIVINISEFSEKSPITNINSLPINHLVW